MAIAIPLIALILEEGKRLPYQGEVIQFGRQEIWCAESELESLAKKIGYRLSPVAPEPLVSSKFRKGKRFISDTYFFKRLGFRNVYSLDASGFEGAGIIFDLNEWPVASKWRGRFDLVVDAGTLEHVFHLPNAMQNIFDLLNVEGRVMHAAPVANYFDHGFYSFSPCFFTDYYLRNGYRIDQCQLTRNKVSKLHLSYKVADCGPGSMAARYLSQVGALDGKVYGLFFVATRLPGAKGDLLPQQGYYERVWTPGKDAESSGGLIKAIYKKLTALPVIGPPLSLLANRVWAWLMVRWRKVP